MNSYFEKRILPTFFSKTQVSGFLSEKANSLDVFNRTETNGLLLLKANSADVYSKTATDTLLTTLGNSKANVVDVFNKTQVNELLSGKTNSLNVFNRTETNGLLLLKANSADVYSKTAADTLLATLGNSKANITDVNAALNAKVPWVYDSVLTLDAIHTDILRPKKAGQTHIKIDTDLTVVGACNIGYVMFFPSGEDTSLGGTIIGLIVSEGSSWKKKQKIAQPNQLL